MVTATARPKKIPHGSDVNRATSNQAPHAITTPTAVNSPSSEK